MVRGVFLRSFKNRHICAVLLYVVLFVCLMIDQKAFSLEEQISDRYPAASGDVVKLVQEYKDKKPSVEKLDVDIFVDIQQG